MPALEVKLTNINQYWNDEYVNIACTGPSEGAPCPYGPTRQAVWALHDDEQAYEYLCRQCGEDLKQRSELYYGTDDAVPVLRSEVQGGPPGVGPAG